MSGDDEGGHGGLAMKQQDKVKDPVCGMWVAKHDHEASYQQMPFAFCSDQCRTRFLAYPHLYIGYPGAAAPKQEGKVVFKRRRLHLQQALSVEGEVIIDRMLRDLMGVTSVTVAGDSIEITYDLLQVSLKELEAALVAAGAQFGEGWAARLRRALINTSEETEIEASEVTSPHHYRP